MNTFLTLKPLFRLGFRALLPLLVLLPSGFFPIVALAQGLESGKRGLRVMTYNVDEGTDFIEVQNAQNLTQFLIAAGQTITQVRATNPPARMQRVATQILAANPTLVSLQEVDQWWSGSFNPITGACGPTNLEFDMLQELMDALAAQGGHYQVAVQNVQFAFPPTPGLILPSTFLCVQFSDSNVILARTDLNPAQFEWGNPQTGRFVNQLVLPTPAGPVPLPRVWSSVDVQFHGNSFRFVNTHLESASASIREMQARELIAVLASNPTPFILAMDGNAQAFPLPMDLAYMDFMAAGYNDVWTELFPLAPGLTCCQAQFVNNPVSQLYQRIDLILTQGNIEPRRIGLFGVDPSSMTPGGLWPSDHAGVAARLKLEGDDDPEDD